MAEIWYNIYTKIKKEVIPVAQSRFCLWLDGQRIYGIRALREHFDTSVLIGYLIGGGLELWLESLGENAILERVRGIDRGGNLAEQLAYAFGVRPEPREAVMLNLSALEKGSEQRRAAAQLLPKHEEKLEKAAESQTQKPEDLAASSFLFKSSFIGGSFTFGSGVYGSFRVGSFRKGSFGSFGRGSFGSFGSGVGMAALHAEFIGGSFRYFSGNAEITQSEYKKTMINLSSCPLNRYGYGINLV